MKEMDLFSQMENQTQAKEVVVDSNVKIFENIQVETISQNDIIFFRLTDIEKVLGLSGGASRQWVKDSWFDADEIYSVRNSHGGSNSNFVAESGLYRILNRTNSPKARPFERWVTKEVLPSIRKTGSYSLQPQIPKSYGEALLEAGRLALEKEKLEAQIKADKPLVDFAKDVSQSSNAISVGEFAKLLNTQGIKLGQNKLFAWLRENGYLMRDNEPYQKFVDCGYFSTIEQVYQTFNSKQTTLKTLITGKGQIYFHKKLSAVFKLKNQIVKA